MPRLKVIRESESGRNTAFKDTKTNKTMSRAELAKEIDKGKYPDYHNRKINNVKTPCSNPDNSKNNNLG